MIFKKLGRTIKQQFYSVKTIATHDGAFHADEVLGCTMLTKYTDEFYDANIVRTRDPSVLAAADLVLDVGGEYNPKTKRYDHHQREFTETFTPFHDIRMSSAGLIYRHYGREVVKKISNKYINQFRLGVDLNDPKTSDLIYYKLYESFIYGMDGIDNGVSQYPTDAKPRYSESTGISSRVGRLNPYWHQNFSAEEQLERFRAAIEIMDGELNSQVKDIVVSWVPSKNEVQKAFNKRFETHSSGHIIKLETPCQWKSHILDIEKDAGEIGRIKYVLYPDRASKTWRIQAVPAESGSFQSRKPLKEAWRGLRDTELADKTGVKDARFVHHTGFIGGAKSYEGVLKMAVLNLE